MTMRHSFIILLALLHFPCIAGDFLDRSVPTPAAITPEPLQILDGKAKELKQTTKKEEFYILVRNKLTEVNKKFAQAPSKDDAAQALWLYYYITATPLYIDGTMDFLDNKSMERDLEAKNAALSSIYFKRKQWESLCDQYQWKKTDMIPLIAEYSARIVRETKNRYNPNLDEEIRKKEAEYQAKTVEFFRNLVKEAPERFTTEPYPYEEECKQLRFSSLRNNSARFYLKEFQEKWFMKILLALFPDKEREIRKYIGMAGYEGDEALDLIDRTVGRDKETEFLYKGSYGRRHDKKVKAK